MSDKNHSLKKRGNIFRITVTSIVILSSLLITNISIASAYDIGVDEFSQRKLVTIDNTGNANALTDYQVKIDVAYEPEMQSHFDDLRFTDTSDNILNYWIEDYIPSTSAAVWVKIPSIPGSGTTTIYMYYGNAGVGTESDGDATFDFFDDFEDGVIGSPWIEVENKGTITETNGYLETPECGQAGNQYCQDGYAYVYFDISDTIPGWDITKPFRIRVENWNQEDNTGGEAATTCLWNTIPHHNTPLDAVYFFHIDGNTAAGRYFGCYGGTSPGDYGPLENRWIIEEFRFDGNEMSLWFDEVEKDSFSWSASEGFIVLGNTRNSDWSIDNNRWDNIFVAEYADPEPTVTFAPTVGTPTIIPEPSDEGSSVTVSATFSAAAGDGPYTCTVNYGDGSSELAGTISGNTCTGPAHTYADNGDYSVSVSVTDTVDGDTCTNSASHTVNNVAPTVDSIITPIDPVDISNSIMPSATFSDSGTNDGPFICTVNYGDGLGELVGTISGNTCTGPSHTYTEAGVYTITFSVADKDCGVGTLSTDHFIVMYDPDGGFVTGGGWIDSPSGAYTPDNPDDPDIVGRANFGFVSKYKKGASVPTGQTEFHFKAANLNFHSDVYDWLVVANVRAQFKGTGTINGEGEYGFMLTAIDADINDDDNFIVDMFRIKIWDKATEEIVYDNKYGAYDTENEATELGGGNIIIHT